MKGSKKKKRPAILRGTKPNPEAEFRHEIVAGFRDGRGIQLGWFLWRVEAVKGNKEVWIKEGEVDAPPPRDPLDTWFGAVQGYKLKRKAR